MARRRFRVSSDHVELAIVVEEGSQVVDEMDSPSLLCNIGLGALLACLRCV